MNAVTHTHLCRTCTLPYDCESDKDDLGHCARREWLGHDCPECHLRFLTRQIANNLEEAIQTHRDDGQKISANEAELASDWSRILVMLMSQGQAREVSDRLAHLYDSLVIGVAEEVKEFNQDHSAAFAIDQALDRMVMYLRQSNPMTAAMRIVRLMAGARAW